MGRSRCILGTAGHIDHGKSSLVKALTGTDPDRLEEEKARGMTIVLGFAEMTLSGVGDGPNGVHVGIVDVPGHERFIRTMVAGATGIDFGMLVVAADDGVMPQTREHVEILDLLGVHRGLVAVTKADLVHDDRISTVREGINELLDSTGLRDWPVVVTSTPTGRGLDDIRKTLGGLIEKLPPRQEQSFFRLAIDRVFAIRGRGTVVTGSVLSGHAASGSELDLQPSGVRCKVREAHSHGSAVSDVSGGQRGALNLTGLDRAVIERGMELATPGYLTGARYVDARVRILARRQKAFVSHRKVRVSMGTSETMAMLVVVGGDRIEPGAEALVQLRFHKPVVASFGQRFILRSESAHATLGGGHVVRPVSRRVRPKHSETMEGLKRAESTDAFERFAEAVRWAGFEDRSAERLSCETSVEMDQVEAYRQRMQQEESLTQIGSRQVHRDTVGAIERRALAYLNRHHANNPSEPGVSRDRLVGWIGTRSAPGMGKSILVRLEARGLVRVQGPYVAHHEFRPALSDEDAVLLGKLVDEITAAEFDPPEWVKLNTIRPLTKPRAKVLADLAKIEPALVSFAPQRYISAESLAGFRRTIGELGNGGRPFKLAEVRDALGLSRRVVQPLLEFLDRVRFTRRVGDERILLGESDGSPPRS